MVVMQRVTVALTAAVAALGSALFIALSFLHRRRSVHAHYRAIQQEEEPSQRQVLVLGLDGAGKSSMLRSLREPESAPYRPTRGFNFISLSTPACQLHFLEIGGEEDLRKFWPDYLKKSHILVFVVDSSDRKRIPVAKTELHRLLKLTPRLPVVVLGNKQDQSDSLSMSELRAALSLDIIPDDQKIFLLATQLKTPGQGLDTMQDLLLQLI